MHVVLLFLVPNTNSIFISEWIAIARVLIHNPKVLLLDKVDLTLSHFPSFQLHLIFFCRPHLHLTLTQRRWCKKHLTKHQKGGQPLQSHTGYQQFKMQIACELFSSSTVLPLNDCDIFSLLLRYFIKDGSVQESGSHDELVVKHGTYFEYVQLQALSKMEV